MAETVACSGTKFRAEIQSRGQTAAMFGGNLLFNRENEAHVKSARLDMCYPLLLLLKRWCACMEGKSTTPLVSLLSIFQFYVFLTAVLINTFKKTLFSFSKQLTTVINLIGYCTNIKGHVQKGTTLARIVTIFRFLRPRSPSQNDYMY